MDSKKKQRHKQTGKALKHPVPECLALAVKMLEVKDARDLPTGMAADLLEVDNYVRRTGGVFRSRQAVALLIMMSQRIASLDRAVFTAADARVAK